MKHAKLKILVIISEIKICLSFFAFELANASATFDISRYLIQSFNSSSYVNEL